MGTRHLTAVYLNGEPKVAQYGQWDGYPDGQGITTLNILRAEYAKDKLASFRERVAACSWMTEADEAEVRKHFPNDWLGMDEAERYNRMFPLLTRNAGAKVLEMIPGKLNNSIGFAADGLFCEWAWVIDLDAGVFEAYDGFHKKGEEIKGRFKDMPTKDDEPIAAEYTPVSLRASWPLDDLPSDEAFLEAFNEEGAEEDAA